MSAPPFSLHPVVLYRDEFVNGSQRHQNVTIIPAALPAPQLCDGGLSAHQGERADEDKPCSRKVIEILLVDEL